MYADLKKIINPLLEYRRKRGPEPIVLLPKSKPTSQTIMIDLALQPVARCGCGKLLEYGATYCGYCGVQLQEVLVR
jgi:hypothetical protein